MASKKSRAQSEMPQFLRVDEAMRKNLVRHFQDFQEKERKQTQERNATLLQMAKHLSEVQGQARPASGDRRTAKALDHLLGIHKKLAKQKLAPPAVVPGPGGGVVGRITVTATPPYDFDQVIPGPYQAGFPPILTGSANRSTGQISSSAVTAWEPGLTGGDMYTTVGIFFLPPGPGTLTVSVNPIYSFEWWTESYFAAASASIHLGGLLWVYGTSIVGPLQQTGPVAQAFVLFNETETGDPLIVKDGFNLQGSASVSIPVDQTQVYLLYVAADCAIQGIGSLGSIAGSILSVTVPSISYEFQMNITNA